MWKEKQRRKAKEKMDSSVRAAILYDKISESKEKKSNAGRKHKRLSRKKIAATHRKTVIHKIFECARLALIFAAIIFAFAVIATIYFYNFSLKNHGAYVSNKPNQTYTEKAEIQTGIDLSDITEGLISYKDISIPNENQQFAIIESEKLGEKGIDVYYQGDYSCLKQGAVTENETLVGYDGYTLIYAYHSTVFKNIKNLEIGDKINVTTEYGKYVYKIEKIETTKPKSEFVVEKNSSTLILQTDLNKSIAEKKSSKQIYVYCTIISGPTIMG